MSSSATVAPSRPAGTSRRPPRRGAAQERAGWLFVAPMVVVLGLFLLVPICMAVWVSTLDWNGQGSPFAGGADFVGLDNYASLLTVDGLPRRDFMLSLRNTFYYVLFVVPLQTALALFLAIVVNQRYLRGRSFFRTAFYFPSVTSSVAITIVFLFMFQNSGVVNTLLGYVGISGPQWFADPRGLFQVIASGLGLVDVSSPPASLTGSGVLGLSWWEWLSGPSVALLAVVFLVVWTTAGTFMLMFLAALQDIPVEVEEAARLDGVGPWQKFRFVTLPQLKPVLFLVLTLGLIGTWQVFDQVYLLGGGNPAKTTLTPAFLSYKTGFRDFDYGNGAAIAFMLFLIIIAMTLLQRYVLRDKDAIAERRARRAQTRTTAARVAASSSGTDVTGTGVGGVGR